MAPLESVRMNLAVKSVFGLALLAAPLRATPEFVGVLIAPGVERFALADPHGGQPIRWVRLGQQIEGYTVAEYFPATETLSLQNAAGTTSLALRPAKTAELTPTAADMLRCATQVVASNERWAGPIRFQGPHLFKHHWIVVAHCDGAAGTETRVVVFSALGVMKDYLAQPALPP